jgi:hypothetical protein
MGGGKCAIITQELEQTPGKQSTGISRFPWKNYSFGLGGGLHKCKKVMVKYSKFMGPGFMVSVAYIDPGIYFPSFLLSSITGPN